MLIILASCTLAMVPCTQFKCGKSFTEGRFLNFLGSKKPKLELIPNCMHCYCNCWKWKIEEKWKKLHYNLFEAFVWVLKRHNKTPTNRGWFTFHVNAMHNSSITVCSFPHMTLNTMHQEHRERVCPRPLANFSRGEIFLSTSN